MLTFNKIEYTIINNLPKLKITINIGGIIINPNDPPLDPGTYRLIYNGGLNGQLDLIPDYSQSTMEVILDLDNFDQNLNIELQIVDKCNIIQDNTSYNHCENLIITDFNWISQSNLTSEFRINTNKIITTYIKWQQGINEGISTNLIIPNGNNIHTYNFTTAPPQSGAVEYRLFTLCSQTELAYTNYQYCEPIINTITIDSINVKGITQLTINGNNLLPKNNNQNTNYRIKITQIGLIPNPSIIDVPNVNLIEGNTDNSIIISFFANINPNISAMIEILDLCNINNNNSIKTTNYNPPSCLTSSDITFFNFNIITKPDQTKWGQFSVIGNFTSPKNFKISFTNTRPDINQQTPNPNLYNRTMSGGITTQDLNGVLSNGSIVEFPFDPSLSTNYFYFFKNDTIGNNIKLIDVCNGNSNIISQTTWFNCEPSINSFTISSKESNGNDKIFPSVQLFVQGTNLLPTPNGTTYKLKIKQSVNTFSYDIILSSPPNSNNELYISLDTSNIALDLSQDVQFELGSPCTNNLGNTLLNGITTYEGRPIGKCSSNMNVNYFELHDFYLSRTNQGFIGSPPNTDWHFLVNYSLNSNSNSPASYYVVVQRETNCPTSIPNQNAINLQYELPYIFIAGQNQILNLSVPISINGCDNNNLRRLTNLECPMHLYGIKNVKRCYADFNWRIKIYCQKFDYDNNLPPISEKLYQLQNNFKPNFNIEINKSSSNKGRVDFNIINLNTNEGIPLNISYFILRDNNQIISNPLTMNYNYSQSTTNNSINVNGLLYQPPSTGFVNYKICAYYCTENTGSGLFPYTCPENLIKCSNLVQL